MCRRQCPKVKKLSQSLWFAFCSDDSNGISETKKKGYKNYDKGPEFLLRFYLTPLLTFKFRAGFLEGCPWCR